MSCLKLFFASKQKGDKLWAGWPLPGSGWELSRRRPGDTHPTPRWQEGPLASEGFSKSVKLQESLFK